MQEYFENMTIFYISLGTVLLDSFHLVRIKSRTKMISIQMGALKIHKRNEYL
jgi:hypothetical protein